MLRKWNNLISKKPYITIYNHILYEYYDDEEGDPFDPLNLNNWDGDQQVGFRDRD